METSFGISFIIDDKYRIWRHLLLQTLVVMITIGIFFDAPDVLNISLGRFYGWIGYFLFINMLIYFNAFVLFPCFLAKRRIFAYVVSSVIFVLFSIFVMMVLQECTYDIALTRQEEVPVMVIILNIVSSLFAIFFFLGGISALLLFKQWMSDNLRINNLKSVTSQSELKFLKSQINPHFLFNMLNNAKILVDEDPDKATSILQKLDELLRYQLNDSLQDKVFLEADIDFLTNFLELEKTRRDSFDYSIQKQGELSRVQVAPLLFIPFVENAVKHNSNDGSPYVHISFELQENTLIFNCKNPVSIDVAKKDDGGLGLSNIVRRLDLLFGQKYSLEQSKTDKEYSVNLQLIIE